MSLSKQQIENGIWLFNHKADWDQKIIKYPEEYRGEERIMVDCTQLRAAATYKDEKKLIEKWCNFLPSMTNLRYLYFESRTNPRLLEGISQMKFLEGLYIKWSNIEDISPLIRLQKLRHLHIGGSPKIKDISPLTQLTDLETLDLENIRVLNDIAVICELATLEGLGIHGSLWTTQKIVSLIPIQMLQNLKYITLYGTKVSDGSLKPLASLKNLERIWVAPYYRESEYVYLIKNLPNLKYGNVLELATQERNNTARRDS